VLRPLIAGIVAEGGPGGWTLRSGPRATMTIEYDVVDSRDQSVVIHDRATLSCGSAPAVPAPNAPSGLYGGEYPQDAISSPPSVAVATACRDATDITELRTVHGSTSYAADVFHGSCAGGTEQPDHVYRLRVRTAGFLHARLESEFDGALYLRASCTSSVDLVCNDDDGDTRHSAISRYVTPGVYFIFVDGYGTLASCSGSARRAGSFVLTTSVDDSGEPTRATAEVTESSSEPVNVVRLVAGSAVSGSTVGHFDRFHSTCAGGSHSPDQAYALDLDRASRVRLALSGDFDGSIYIRSSLREGGSELACNDDANDTRHSLIDTVLPAGHYLVIVDGFSSSNAGTYQLRSDVYQP
jgi:hypothetical protein